MFHFIGKHLLVITAFFIPLLPLFAGEKEPNGGFTMESLVTFFPGKKIAELGKDKALQSDILEDNGNQKILKFKIKKASYNLDLYVQVKGDDIIDLFVRLPQHFSHDIFLKELQKRYKKQDRYVQKDLSALYAWMNRDGHNILYHGSCSITCFPMFIEIVSAAPGTIPLYQKFNEALPKW